MPQGSKAVPAGECPHCFSGMHLILWRDGFGLEEIFETHCNSCGYALDGEGNLRSLPTNEALMQTIRMGKEY